MAFSREFENFFNQLGMDHNRPMRPHPRGDYTGPDAQGNYPEVEEPMFVSTNLEPQQLSNPFARMFGDLKFPRNSMYDNDERKAKYQESFSRRISDMSGDAALSAFFDAVRNNDAEWVEAALQSKDITSPAKNEDHRRAALIIAIKNRHIDVEKVLLEHDAPIGNAFFYAVDGSSTTVVKVLCDHLRGKKAILDSAINSFSEVVEFPSTTTPLLTAASENKYEIVELLIGAGAELPSLEAVLAKAEHSHDIYERALARLHWHKAMSSEAYLLFGRSEDPVKAAFEAGQTIEGTMKNQLTHIKPEYKALREKLDQFLTKLLEMTQNSAEISTLLSEKTCDIHQYSDYHERDKPLPRRLVYALDLKFRDFIAHNNCQQYILDRWYLYHTQWEELPMAHFFLRTALIFLLMPILCLLYILLPIRVVQSFMKMPYVRFILQMASRIAFLMFLIYATISSSVDQQIAAQGERDELAPTPSPEELREARIEHYLEYRGCPKHMVIWLIYVWIAGMTWREMKEFWKQGVTEYLADAFNCVDITQFGLYWSAIVLTFVSYYRALKDVNSPKWETWDSCAAKTDEFGSESPVDEPEDPRAVHAIFECQSRIDWSAYDPLLISEGCFAIATVLTFLGALRDTVILSFVGPLRISLGGMIVDIIRFIVLFLFLWVSFSIGMTQLYETFMILKILECEPGEDCHPAFLTFWATMGTLFWSLFDLTDIEELEVHPKAGMVFTEGVGLLLYASYLVIAVVVMLNALIAMMSNTYTRVEENTEVLWKFARTRLMVDYIDKCPTLPAPFNLIPTPKFIFRVCKRLYACCHTSTSLERKKMTEAKDRNVRENEYKHFIQSLTDRYINDLKTEQLDDDSERLTLDLSNLKETLRAMRNQMRDMKAANCEVHEQVTTCVNTIDDIMKRQKHMEEQQKEQLQLLRRGSLGMFPPSISPSPPPRSKEDEIQRGVAALEEAASDIFAISDALNDVPWIDSDV